MTVTLIVEIVVAVLLVITFTISLVLNRRLGNLRANQDEMRRLIGEFDKALTKARQGMTELKTASAGADAAHEERMKQAKILRDELGFMIETADRLADRLAGEASGNRAARQDAAVPRGQERPQDRGQERPAAERPQPVTPFPAKRAAATSSGNRDFRIEPRSEAERELLMALRQAR
ncbi:MAG: DUF6468 domain-containing protein [Ferrovibrio sp.]